MRLTDEQFQTLSQYETQFRTAVKARWARFPGTAALHQIHKIQREVTGRATSLNTSCSTCVLRLLTEMGNIYFKDKEEREAPRKVELQEKEIPTEAKVEVKTENKKRRRKNENRKAENKSA